MYKKNYLFLYVLLIVIFVFNLPCYSSEIYPETLISVSENTKYAVIVDKSLQKLFLYNTEERTSVLTFDCSTGERKGRKRVEGDKKTPEGVYFFTAKYGDKDLTPVYGTKAFPIDYPNIMDSLMGRNGDAIWLHGTDKKVLVKRSSNGCIALNNKDIDKLAPYLKISETPFIILKSSEFTPSKNRKRDTKEISSLLKQWALAIEKGSYHFFLGFYDESYLPEIYFWRDWIKLREKDKGFGFKVENRSIFKHEDYYVAKFDLVILKGKFTGEKIQKKLFLKDIEGTFKIIGDENLYTLVRNRKRSSDLLKAAAKTAVDAHARLVYEKRQKLIKDIKSQTHKWAKAWSSGDIETYKRFYSVDFYSKAYRMNLKQWVKHKKSLKYRYKYINVSVKNEKIDIFKDQIKVAFTQIYKSSGYKETGIKKLYLKPEGDKWKIYRELWTKSY